MHYETIFCFVSDSLFFIIPARLNMYTRIEGTQRFISIRTEDINKRFPGLLDAILQATEPY